MVCQQQKRVHGHPVLHRGACLVLAASFSLFGCRPSPTQPPSSEAQAPEQSAQTDTQDPRSTGALRQETQEQFKGPSGEIVLAYRGWFEVPERRDVKGAKKLRLQYLRFPATGKQKGSPIVYLAGGPGGSGIETAKGPRFPLFMALRKYGDVIAFDQRGTGASRRHKPCVSSQVINNAAPLSDEDHANRYALAFNECFAAWMEQGHEPKGYNTIENARDLDALRQHLGAQKLTLWGISYGTHLALAATKIMGNNIDRMVLASVEGLDQTVKLPKRSDAYFERLQQALKDHPLLKGKESISIVARRVLAKLAQAPKPIPVVSKDGTKWTFLLHRRDLQMLSGGLVSDPNRALLLALIYHELDAGGSYPILQKILPLWAEVPSSPITLDLMTTSMDLASGMSPSRAALFQQQRQSAIVGDYLNFPSYPLRQAASSIELDEDFRKDPVSPIPTLLLTGTLDGRTFVEGQKEALAGMSNLVTIIVRNAGHNLFMSSPEVTARIEAFVGGKDVDTNEIVIDLPEKPWGIPVTR